jgi:hypothetical protein
MPAIVWDITPSYPANITNAYWYWGDGTYSVGLSPSHTYAATGMYNICVAIMVSGCTTPSVMVCNNTNIYKTISTGNQSNAMATVNVVNSNPTAISKNTADEIAVSLFPNPGSGEFEVKISNVKSVNTQVRVYDLSGREVYNITEENTNGSFTKRINLSHLSKGTYMVKVTSGNANKTSSLVISK